MRRLLGRAAQEKGPHVAEARWGLVLLLRMQGRFEEARRWLEDGFDAMTSPVETLQRLYKLDIDPFPIEGVRIALERAGKRRLKTTGSGWRSAHLAVRAGDFTDAEAWLERCLERRPDDPVVWRMKLECGLAAGKADQVRQTLSHLPAALETKERVAALRAWLAEREGDLQSERSALEQSIELNAADVRALERLATLEREAGQPELAARFREAIRAVDRDRQQYIHLLASPSPEHHASELAQIAGRLGRRFDAARWAELAAPPGREIARGSSHNSAPTSGKILSPLTLADLLKTQNFDGGRPSKTAATPPVVVEFRDDALAAGLNFVQENGGATGKLIPPVTASGGVGLLDFNNDGWLDVYFVQGGAFPPDPKSGASAPGDRLFRNRGDGSFEDVTTASGLDAFPRRIRSRRRRR